MNADRFQAITSRYSSLRIAVVGDFCLDRYLEIDPAKQEISIETGLPVHNVTNVRSQPGAAGTILNNLVALGIGEIYPVGFYGEDGEGFELRRALLARPGVKLDYFIETAQRRTFTYCKPLVMTPGKPPVELNRLDSKNWSSTPASLQDELIDSLTRAAKAVDAVILMDQVDLPETGVITSKLLEAVGRLAAEIPDLLVLADSRRGLRGWPSVCFKMNAAELQSLAGTKTDSHLDTIREAALAIARKQGRPVFVTLSERGILAATPQGEAGHSPALPVRGPIDIVGAGDSVTANLTVALASGANVQEACVLSMAASSIVIHQLGTTGTASVAQIAGLLQ
jgi:rfaE bifunctional protein kinase chain/domain